MNRKGFLHIALAALFAAALVFGGAVYYAKQSSAPQPVFCTEEAKVCSDGSYVSRIGPSCEFAACPTVSPASTSSTADSSTALTASWKTYRNEKYGLEFKYPNGWFVSGDAGPIDVSSASPSDRIHGLGIPSHGAWISIKKGICNGPTNDFVPQEYGPPGTGSNVLKKTTCSNSFQTTLDLYRTDPDFAKNKEILEEIAKTVRPTLDTSTWKTYRSEQYGFEVKYPDALVSVENNSKGAIFKNLKFTDIEIGLSVTEGFKNYQWEDGIIPDTRFWFDTKSKQWELNDPHGSYKNREYHYSKTVGGLEIYHFSTGDVGYFSEEYVIPIEKQDRVVVLSFGGGGEHPGAPEIYDAEDALREAMGLIAKSMKVVGVVTPIDTSNWKTYRNEEYKFELKYPPEWRITSGTDSVEFTNIKNFNSSQESDPSILRVLLFRHNVNPKLLSMNDWLKEFIGPAGWAIDPISSSIVTIGGHSAVRLVFFETGTLGVTIYVGNGTDVIAIGHELSVFGKESPFTSIFSKILSTFKFTK